MRGHDQIIKMRHRRMKPEIVFVNDYPCKTDWHKWTDESVTICTHGDTLETLDVRFLVGLTVNISSTVESRAKRLFQLAKDAGAAAVAACHVQKEKHATEQAGWSDYWRKGVNHG